MSGSVTAVLFDVDGTLVDTNYLHVVAWWEAFEMAGHHVPMARIHRGIGMGSDQMLDKLLPGDRDKDEDDTIRTAHAALYSVYWPRLRPLPGADDLLRACRDRELSVVLASSADPQQFEVLKKVLGVTDEITAATSAGDVEASKPEPDLVNVALERAQVPPEQAVFVGDAVWDAQACRRAGVTCVGVRSGGVGADELTEAGAVRVYQDPAELLAAFPDSLLAPAG